MTRLVSVAIVGCVCLVPASCALFPGETNGRIDAAREVGVDSGPMRAGLDHTHSSTNVASEGPLTLTVQEATLLALENNQALKLERLDISINKTFEQQERAAFDPSISGGYSSEGSSYVTPSTVGTEDTTDSDTLSGNMSLGIALPTGTKLSLEAGNETLDSSGYTNTLASSRIGVSLTQPLLRGLGTGANLAKLRQARLDVRLSEYEFRAFAEQLLAEVEKKYWDYYLSIQEVEIYEESLKLAQQQLQETEERIAIGSLAETERTAAEAEVAFRQEGLINAKSTREVKRLNLLRLLNPPGTNRWTRQIELKSDPVVSGYGLDADESHVAVALRMRSELNQARLSLMKGDLEIVKTRNGLLPKMDLFITLGNTGYADSFSASARDFSDGHDDVLAGFTFEYPIGNRDAHAQHTRAVLQREQAAGAIDNLIQLINEEIRTACIERNRSKEQVAATIVTRKLQEEKLRVEREKFRVGKSTGLLVAQVQRDLLQSRLSEMQAVVTYLKSFIELYRFDGSLLERRGISAPGSEPFAESW